MTNAHQDDAGAAGERPTADQSLVLLFGLPSFAVSLLGVLEPMVLLVVGAALGFLTVVLFLRARPTRGPAAVVGLVLGLLAIALPAAILLMLMSWNGD